MKNKFIRIGFFIGLFSIAIVSCDDLADPLVEELKLDRELSPAGLAASIRNLVTIELNWNVREGVDHYVVEFSEDSLEFNTIVRTVTVQPEELPLQEDFFGDTRYSARVKAVSVDEVEDSEWSTITIRTEPENILLPIVISNDIEATEATLKWPAGQFASRFVINPGNIQRDIVAGEVTAGEATITGLDEYTNYTVTMYAGTSQRGYTEFKTLLDANCAMCVKLNAGDDINAALVAAADGSTIVLAPGTYNSGAIPVTKSITLQAEFYYNKPLVNGQITCAVAVNSIAVRDVNFDGTATLGQFFNTVAGCNLTTFSIEGCEIRNYTNGMISNNALGVFGAISISNCYVHSIPGGGGDGLDFRGGSVTSLTVQNSTFANGFRAFLRMQVACNTSFRHCTFYKISGLDNSNNSGIFRAGGVAGANNTLEVNSCLFVETGIASPVNVQSGNWCRNAGNMVATPTYSNNNIFGCLNLLVGLYTTAAEISASELNPGFVNAAAGDFTVTNQTLIDNEIGDPRWR